MNPILRSPRRRHLVRIAREALHNIAKHAQATHVELAVEVGPSDVMLLVADDGRGFDPYAAHPGHFGLQLMREQAMAVGATLELTDVTSVVTALGSLALEPQELLDLRYSAFTSLERAGPTPECIDLLRQLSNDEIPGRSARSALVRWHLE
jgi:signal transduction histidine kinase